MSTGKVRASRAILRGARHTLGLDQAELAELAGLAVKTVGNFERSASRALERTRSAIQKALETQGAVFTNGDKPGFWVDTERAGKAKAARMRLAEEARSTDAK